MKKLSIALKIKSRGPKVTTLHNALQLAKIKISGKDLERNYFGVATRNAIRAFQKREKLAVSGKLNAETVAKLNLLLKEAEEKDPPIKEEKGYVVTGIITGKDGKALEGMEVKAVDYDLGNFENRLGKPTKTNEKGQYHIPYTERDFRKTDAERGGADIIIRVYGKGGGLVGESEMYGDTERVSEINLSVDYFITPEIKIPEIDPKIEIEAIRLKSLPNLGNLSTKKAYSFYTAPFANKKRLVDQWHAEKSITAKKRESLIGSIGLMEITDSNTAIIAMLGEKEIANSAALVQFDSKSLGKIIAANTDTPEKGKEAEVLAQDILKKAEQKNPSTFFMHRLISKPEFANIDPKLIKKPSKQLKTFYSKNKDFDLLAEPIVSAKTGQLNEKIKLSGKATPKLVKELANTQQALLLGKDSDLSLLLYSKDVNISKAMQMSHTGLMKELGIDAHSAIKIKERAQTQHETAMNGFLAYKDILGNPFIKKALGSFFDVRHGLKETWGKGWAEIVETHGLKDLDSISDLFGSQNYCDCEHCRSVLSPAAYFVDLMQFVEKRVLKKEGATESILAESNKIHLRTRRPDLWKLPLTCENTNLSVPYVRIIVEVLSAFVQSQLGTSKTVETRLAGEISNLEFTLPYNHTLEKVRHWLSFFEVSRLALLEQLHPNPNAAQRLMIALERLHLSKEQYELIIKQTHNAIVDKDVLAFRKKSGLGAEETQLFVSLPFWQSKVSIVQKVDASDLQKMTLEFSSNLTGWQGIFHRLFRLWKATGLTLEEFGQLTSAIGLTHATINKNAILNMAELLKLKEVLGFNLSTTIAIVNGIPDTSNGALSWSNLLPETWVVNNEIGIQELLDNSTDEAITTNQLLQGIYGISSAEIGTCIAMLTNVIGTVGGTKVKFDPTTLNTIYQYLQLYIWTGLPSIADYKSLLALWGNGTFKTFDSSIDNMLDFIRFIRSYTKLNYTLEDIIYLFDEALLETTVNDASKTYLTSEATQALILTEEYTSGDKFSILFNDWLSIDPKILKYYRNFISKTDSQLNTLFNKLKLAVIPDASIIELSNIKIYIERLEYATSNAGLSMEDMLLIAVELSNFQFAKLGFTNWNDKDWIKGFPLLGKWITETSQLYNFDLWQVLIAIEKDDMDTEQFRKSIAKWKGIPKQEVNALFTASTSLLSIESDLKTIEWIKKLNLNSVLLNKLNTGDSLLELKTQETILCEAIRSTFKDNSSFEAGIVSLQSKLDSKLRDALVAFIIFNSIIRTKNFGFENSNDLYDYFLLDITMDDCFELPRIVVATNSVQAYISRCLLGLEISADEKYRVLLDLDEMEEWEWRKNYRVWEANRKIFLFPENYIEPEIRDNKTPEFKVLEDELLQQKLDLEVVENAYKTYIHQVMKLAELKIAGAYLDTDYKVYLFGRTAVQPNEYYYRHVEFTENGARIWSNWEKMNVAIPTEDVSAARVNNKLYVFWTTYQRRDISIVQGGNHELHMHVYDVFVNYTHQKIDGKWSEAQTIAMGYRKSSTFDPYLRIDEFEDLILNSNTSSPSFKVEAEDIRENVLKSFQNTVYRKPYPSIVPSDSNQLAIDFIWSDKKDALQARYKWSRAIIDSFEVDITIKIVRPYWFDGEDDKTFFFPRYDGIVNRGSSNETSPPNSLIIADVIRTFTIGDDTLRFKMVFDESNLKYRVIPLSSSGNDKYFFKNLNEVANGSYTLEHQIDHIPVASVKTQRNVIDLSHQILKNQDDDRNINLNTKLNNEYQLYYDNFNAFHIGDEGYVINQYYSIQNQREFVSELQIPSQDDGVSLNPEGLQMLWRKVSTSVNELLNHVTQNHVKDQINYDESFGNYFYEIFFHIPMRIADHLNAAGKFREADIWFRYIYDPTNTKNEFESLAFPADVNWNFAAFREIGIKKLQAIYSDENAIEQYKRNPGNPHAIARMRISAYQKNTVMKYVDNLLDWGDYLFQQFTPESTSEARNIYGMVKNILGDKPMSVGACKEVAIFKYEDIDFAKNEATGEFIYNAFSKLPVRLNPRRPRKRVKGKGKFASDLNSKIKITKYNYVSDEREELLMDYRKESKLNNNDVSNFKRYDVKVSGIAKAAIGFDKNRKLFDKVYGRPKVPVKYIDVKSDLIFCFPKNELFLEYWNRVDDRIYKLNNCLDIYGVKRTMPAYAPVIDPALLASMVGSGLSFDDIIGALNSSLPNHKFSFLIEKAKQFCGTIQSFGNALFAAIEKKDNEELTLLRSVHQQNIEIISSKVKRNNLEQAQVNLSQALQNKTGLEMKIAHYTSLLDEGLIPWEQAEQIAKWTAGGIRIGEGVLQFLSGGLRLVPQLGSPFAMKYGGLELGDSANRFANALAASAKVADNIAMLAGMEGGHQRREQGWQFQLDSLNEELLSMEESVKNAELRILVAEYDLELHEKNMEQYQELHDFYTNKFSSFNHYTFQVGQLQTLYKMAYNLASQMASDAQKAYNFERGLALADPGVIEASNWNSEKLGLLAGENLLLQLQQLEKDFIDSDVVEKQITQHFSLKQLNPEKLLELKINGIFNGFTISEAAFDVIYPGFYRRRIKSVRISIPCITGPYTNIGATLKLEGSKLRTSTNLAASALEDFSFSGSDFIATSSAQNDGGQFDLNFNGSKYLPFEGAGAVSTWALSLPTSVRSFDYNSISDVIFHISYEAEFDGVMKTSVESNIKTALGKLNGSKSIRIFSLKHDFPNDWHKINLPTTATDVEIEIKKEHFPFFTSIQDFDGVEAFSYVHKPDNSLEKKNDSLGITKSDTLQITIPVAINSQGYKDVIFFISYKVN